MIKAVDRKYRVFGITYFSYAVIYVTRKSLSVVKTLLQEDLGLSTYNLGSIDSAFLGAYAVFQIFLPSLSDTYGVRPILIISFASAAFFSFCFGISQNVWCLIGTWLCEGTCHAAVFSVLIKAVSLWFPSHQRAAALGIWTTSQQVGAIGATTLATLVSTHLSWRHVFHVAAAITGFTAFLLYLYLPEPPENIDSTCKKIHEEEESVEFSTTFSNSSKKRRKSKRSGSLSNSADDDDESVKPIVVVENSALKPQSTVVNAVKDEIILNDSERAGLIMQAKQLPSRACSSLSATYENNSNICLFRNVIHIPGLFRCGLSYFCVKLVRYALLFWLPFYLATEKGFSPSLAGYSSMMFDVGGVLGAVATGFMIQTVFKGQRLLATAVLCVGAAFFLALLAYVATFPLPQTTNNISIDFGASLFLMTAIGFLIAGPDSVLGASAASEMCERHCPSESKHILSTATGIVNGLGSFGGVAQGYVTAFVSEKFGWPALFSLFAIGALGGALCLLPLLIFNNTLSRNCIDDMKSNNNNVT